jgi:DNA-binding NarL/FixJ family response regulator
VNLQDTSKIRAVGLSYRPPSMRVNRFTSGLPRVVVLNDYEYVSETVSLLLADRVEIVAKTQSGKAAVALSELFVPDVVIAGEMLMDGVIEYYLQALIQTGARVLLISEPHDTARLLEFVEHGISGFVDNDQSPVVLADAVLVLAAGGAIFPPDVVSVMASDWRRIRRGGPRGSHGDALTPRELEVLGAMSDGLSAKAVAHLLGISVKTVETHKSRIFDKLDVRTQAQAVAMTIANGLALSSLGQFNPLGSER